MTVDEFKAEMRLLNAEPTVLKDEARKLEITIENNLLKLVGGV